MPMQSVFALQTDTRIGNIEVKIKKLDGELSVFKTQMSKMKAGPGKVSIETFCRRELDF